MANIIKIKRSAVPSKVPATSDMDLGELAVNTYDGKLFLKKNNGTESIIEIGGSAGNGYTGSQGAIGYAGSIGYTGSQGPIGYTGSVGFMGSQGTIGYTGSVGFVGSIGATGFTGSRGVIGYTGSRGVSGFTGSQGTLGYTGSQGALGYTGSIGPSGSSVTMSATPPSTPQAGDLWWNTSDGQLKIYYNDGDTSQWVDATASGGGTASGGFEQTFLLMGA